MKTLTVQCPKCGSEFNCISKHGDRRKFCSRSCANSRIWSEEKRVRHSKIAKSLPNYKPARLVTRTCPCGKDFLVRPCLKKKHCCYGCSIKYVKRPPGGYREGSGRSKSGYYKGTYCGSTYELCWVIYRTDKNLQFKRFEGVLEKDGFKYYPDFLVGENHIVEIKGYWTAVVDRKRKMAESMGYSVEVLYKDDLKDVFKHVRDTYGTKNFSTLYDGYKPKYFGNCSYCGKEFSREKAPKTKETFCSRSCCGKHRQNTPCR